MSNVFEEVPFAKDVTYTRVSCMRNGVDVMVFVPERGSGKSSIYFLIQPVMTQNGPLTLTIYAYDSGSIEDVVANAERYMKEYEEFITAKKVQVATQIPDVATKGVKNDSKIIIPGR